jgi:hypothetical protein
MADTDASTETDVASDDTTSDTASGTEAAVDTQSADDEPTDDQKPAPRQNITVTNVTVDTTAPSVGETVVINVTATNRGTADGTYPFTVRLNGSSDATHEISVPAGATRTQRYEQNLTAEGELSVAGTPVTTVSAEGDGSLLPAPVAGLLAGLPDPLALWPSGIIGTVLGAFVGLVVVVYTVLKALAIYLGY